MINLVAVRQFIIIVIRRVIVIGQIKLAVNFALHEIFKIICLTCWLHLSIYLAYLFQRINALLWLIYWNKIALIVTFLCRLFLTILLYIISEVLLRNIISHRHSGEIVQLGHIHCTLWCNIDDTSRLANLLASLVQNGVHTLVFFDSIY